MLVPGLRAKQARLLLYQCDLTLLSNMRERVSGGGGGGGDGVMGLCQESSLKNTLEARQCYLKS